MSATVNLVQFTTCSNVDVYVTRLAQMLPINGYKLKKYYANELIYERRDRGAVTITIDTNEFVVTVNSDKSDKMELEGQALVALILRGVTYATQNALCNLHDEILLYDTERNVDYDEIWKKEVYDACIRCSYQRHSDVRISVFSLNTSASKFLNTLQHSALNTTVRHKSETGTNAVIKLSTDTMLSRGGQLCLFVDAERGFVSFITGEYFTACSLIRRALSEVLATCCDYDLRIE